MTRLSLVAYLVRDYDEAAAWLSEALGFEVETDEPADDKRWVVMKAPLGGRLLLARAEGSRQAAQVGDQHGGRVGFFLEVDDFGAQHRRMIACGVEFEEAPRTEPYGQVAVFRDLYGNRWDLLGPR